MMMKTERMSDESQNSRKNILLSANIIWLMNIIRDYEKQKSLSKMIQNFEDLFHQELVNVKRADKIFIVWEKLEAYHSHIYSEHDYQVAWDSAAADSKIRPAHVLYKYD